MNPGSHLRIQSSDSHLPARSTQTTENVSEPVEIHSVSRAHVRIRFSDTDAMGIVHHSRVFDYFEIAREAYIRRRGVDLNAIFLSGHNIPVSGAGIQFLHPLRFGDVVLVEARIVHLTRARLRFEYQILAQSPPVLGAECFAKGWTEHVYTDMQLNLCRFPREFNQLLLNKEQSTSSPE